MLFVGCVVSLFSQHRILHCCIFLLLGVFFLSMLLKGFGISTRRLGLRTSGWPHESIVPPQQVESLALGPIMDFFYETGYGTISTKIQEIILGLLDSTGVIIWQSLYLWIPLIHIHNKNNTHSFTWEAQLSINPPVWRPVFNRAQCQRKNWHHGIPFAPWAVWMTLLVPRSFESLSRWLTSAKFNSDLEVFEQKLWASLG